MTDTYFHQDYPFGITPMIDPDAYPSVLAVFDEFVKKYKNKPAFSCMGATLTFTDLERKSAQFCEWLQKESGLKPGDRIAVQLPNILQFPVVVWGALRAGLVVVNTNPLYTESEMEHQFNDSGAKLLVVYAGMASKAVAVQPKTSIEKIIVTELADFHKPLKGWIVNTVVKKVKKMVPEFDASKTVTLNSVMKQYPSGIVKPVAVSGSDVAVLQYTGGTTGVSKGAMLTHRNMVANMLQCTEFFNVTLQEGEETFIAPLPLYHIYAFLVHGMLLPCTGNHSVLIPNPRDLPAFVKELKQWKFSGFAGLNTLFVALCNNEGFKALDFSNLKFTISGGMALTTSAAEKWKAVTGCDVFEGYGMTETSPVLTFNPPGGHQLGTIGIAAPNTEIKIVGDDGKTLPNGEAGELLARGPQVMLGYWNRAAETSATIDEDGFIATGDIAIMQDDGFLRIVDRKKDMIIVSGFNVYPNEIEEVVSLHPSVIEAAAIGIPHEVNGEEIQVFLVVNKDVTPEELTAFCRTKLTPYKVPKNFVFRDELPKTNVGKILRRELRTQ